MPSIYQQHPRRAPVYYYAYPQEENVRPQIRKRTKSMASSNRTASGSASKSASTASTPRTSMSSTEHEREHGERRARSQMPQTRTRTRELSPLDILKAGLGLSKERRRARSPVQPATPEEYAPLQGGETSGPGLRSRSKAPAGHKERGDSVPVKPAPANARYVYVAPPSHAGRPRSVPRAAALQDPLAGGAVGGGAVDARAFAASGRERERGVSSGRRRQQQKSPGKKRLRRDRFYSWFLT